MLKLRKDAELPMGEKETHSGCVSTPARMWDSSPPSLPLVAIKSNAYIFSASMFPFTFLQFCFSKQHQIGCEQTVCLTSLHLKSPLS